MSTNGSKETVGSALQEARAKVAGGVEDLRGWAESADATIREFAREKPFVAVACAAGIGFLIGRLASRA